jgi:hypothetical protein
MNAKDQIDRFTNRAIQVCLLLLALSAPISIAATQTAWAFALLFWIIRLVAVRPRFRLVAIDLAVLAFVGLSLISSFLSYEPRVSLGKMAGVSLVTIAYLFAAYVKDERIFNWIVVLVLTACFASSLFAFGTLIVGKNMKVLRLAEDSPLRVAGVEENDTILKAAGHSVASPDQLDRAIGDVRLDGGTVVPIVTYRHELINTYPVPIASLPPGVEGLGILDWSRGRDTRATGFYGQDVTFAEALQLIASLAFGLLLMARGSVFAGNRLLLFIALVAYVAALFLTITRASWLSLVISAIVMMTIVASRRTLMIVAACAVPLIVGGLIYLQQKRQVGFFDTSDDSIAWRLTVWREALNVITMSPRHLIAGIGMDSLKTHWQDWHMFDNGQRPLGHMHSTPIQLAFERGVPTLLAWLVWMGIYLKLLWTNLRRRDLKWQYRGLLLGAFGGCVGMLTSSLVHYNWGDSEVVMIFYLIMGLSLAVIYRLGLPQPQ